MERLPKPREHLGTTNLSKQLSAKDQKLPKGQKGAKSTVGLELRNPRKQQKGINSGTSQRRAGPEIIVKEHETKEI
jgi:hypothetical protein